MTTLEYMERQLLKHRQDYLRESDRGVPQEMLNNIRKKIGYYEDAVKALRGMAMPSLFVEYRDGKPHAYRYGEDWVSMQLAMEGGYSTEEEAVLAWYREQKERDGK